MPWCVRKCPYCDFNSHQLKSAAPDGAYIDALIRDFDAELPRLAGRRIDTVFFGGGTPSLFQPEDFSRLLGALRQRIAFADDVEITLEANPGTIERGRFAGYRDAGINRVSLGAQTFAPRALERLGRIHSAEDTHRAVAELRAAELDNFNLDLMYALPRADAGGSARGCANRAARSSLRTSPTTSSRSSRARCFMRGRRRCRTRMPRGRCKPRVRRCWPRRAIVQYEVSAYAREGARCRHNLNYWLFGDYLGVGAGAHGKLTLALPAAHLAHRRSPSSRANTRSSSRRGAQRRRRRRSARVVHCPRICRSSSC